MGAAMFDAKPDTQETGQQAPANRKLPPESTRFQKGKSGNPRGRPKKDLDLAALAQQHAEAAVRTLALCLTDEKAQWPARVSAAAELLERGFGRAPPSIDHNHKVSLSDEFEAFLAEMRETKEKNAIALQAVPVAIEHKIADGSQEISAGHFSSEHQPAK